MLTAAFTTPSALGGAGESLERAERIHEQRSLRAPEGGHGRVGRRPPEDGLRRDLEQGGDVFRREVLHTPLIWSTGGATGLKVRLDEDMELGPPNFYFRARGRGSLPSRAAELK